MKTRLCIYVAAIAALFSIVAVPAAQAEDGKALTALSVLDSFNRSESPLSNGGKWSALAWDNSGSGHNTGQTTSGGTGGWGPSDAYATINGAYWGSSFSDEGAGIGAAVTLTASPANTSRYLALWIDMSAPGSAKSGYQLRWVQTATAGSYDVTLAKWSSGTETVLASKTAVSIPVGTTLGLVSHGGTVSGWTGTGTLTQLLSASSSTYTGGYSGVEGSGNAGRVSNFRAGPLDGTPPAAPTLSWTDPASAGASTTPRVGGSAETGSTVKLYTNATCTGAATATGTAAEFSTPGIAATVTKNATTTFRATATDAAGNVSSCSSSIAYVQASSEILYENQHITNEEFFLEVCKKERISEVPDPLGSGATVLDFTVFDTDVHLSPTCEGTGTATENPRAMAITPAFIESGQEFWLRDKFLIPSGFPTVTEWMTIVEIFGLPFEGSAPWRIVVARNELGEQEFRYQRNQTYGFDIPWSAPLQTGKWIEVLIHQKFAKEGWVEMWWNGNKITFFGPEGWYNPNKVAKTEKLAMETRDASNNQANNSVRIGQYRKVGMFEVGSVYHQFIKVGTTRASVGG